MGGDPLPCTGKAQAFLSSGLNADGIDLNLKNAGDILAHLWQVRRHPGLLSHKGGVQIPGLPALLPEHVAHLLQKPKAVCILVGGITGGEVGANIPHGKGPQQSICYRMTEDVGVGMAFQPQLPRNIHPADDQPALWAQPVYIISMAYSNTSHRDHPSS